MVYRVWLCDTMNCSPSGSSVHVISQARILGNGLPFPSPGDLPAPEMDLMSPALARGFFTTEPIHTFIESILVDNFYVKSSLKIQLEKFSSNWVPLALYRYNSSFISLWLVTLSLLAEKRLVIWQMLDGKCDRSWNYPCNVWRDASSHEPWITIALRNYHLL